MRRLIAPMLLGLALGILPIAATSAQIPAPTQPQVQTVALAPSGGGSASGKVWIMPGTDSTNVVVTTLVTGLQPNSTHSAHIHSGSCASQGAIVYPLADLVANDAGTATSATLVATGIDSITPGAFYVNVHTGVLGSTPDAAAGISCGDVTAAGLQMLGSAANMEIMNSIQQMMQNTDMTQLALPTPSAP